MGRIKKLFAETKPVLSMYLTAGFPGLDDTLVLCQALERAGAHMLEIGIPFSDPVADGPTIQMANARALENGMNLELLLRQLEKVRETVSVPLVLMGYFNPILQFGFEAFCERAAGIGIDGLIIPDLPPEEYERHYRELMSERGLSMILLITPRTSPERIRAIDHLSQGFLYLVSSSGTTGGTFQMQSEHEQYLKRVSEMKLRNPLMVGFGIHDGESFQSVCRYAHGAIVASAFLRKLAESGDLEESALSFVKSIRGSAHT